MAFNLKEMTVDYKKLLRMVPTQRAAAAESGLLNDIISSLTPGQMVNLFPRYYREQLPDVGQVNRYSSGLDVVLSGGTNLKYRNNNADYPEGPNIDQMKAKLVESGINVQGIYETVGNGILKNDPRVKFLSTLPKDKLRELGFEEFQDENGKTLIKAEPISVPEDVAQGKGIGSVGDGMDLPLERRKQLVFNAVLGQLKAEGFEAVDIRGVAAMLAGQPEQESTFNPTAQHDKDPRTGEYTGYGLYGARLDRRDRMFEWLASNGYAKDDLIGQARYMAHEAVNTPGHRKFMDSMSGMDLTKMAKENPDKFREVMLGFTKNFEAPKYPESGLENRIRGATDTFNYKEENVIAMNKETYTEYMNRQREDKLSRELYNSQYAPTATPIENAAGYVHPVTGKMMHEGHGRTSEFGFGRNRLHAGVDIYSTDPETGKLRVGRDAPVNAPIDGTIVSVNRNRGLAGHFIVMKDENGLEHRFLHTDKNPAINPETGESWKVGERVKQGQTITYVTGSGTRFYDKVQELGDYQAAVDYFDRYGWGSVNKPHLHYEVRKNGKLIDPANVFPEYDVQTGSDPGKNRMLFSTEEDRLLATGEKPVAKDKPSPAPVTNATTALPPESTVNETITNPAVDPGTITPPPPVPPPTGTEQMRDDRPAPETRPRAQQSPPQDQNMYMDMAGGDNKAPPSQYRAFNTARLYEPNSTRLVNGHFA